MEDIEIMKRAKQYMESLANGIDPLTGNELDENDIVNNVRISRCLFYTAGILQKVIDNGGEVQREKLKRSEKAEFSLTDEQALALKPDDTAVSVTRITTIINYQIDKDKMKKLKRTSITKWLLEAGLLSEKVTMSGQIRAIPTEDGRKIGIIEKEFSDGAKTYKTTVYTPPAQQFIFDNIDAVTVIALSDNEKENNKNRAQNSGQPWTQEDDETLNEMYRNGASIKELARGFGRSRDSIKARLAKNGFDVDSYYYKTQKNKIVLESDEE